MKKSVVLKPNRNQISFAIKSFWLPGRLEIMPFPFQIRKQNGLIFLLFSYIFTGKCNFVVRHYLTKLTALSLIFRLDNDK